MLREDIAKQDKKPPLRDDDDLQSLGQLPAGEKNIQDSGNHDQNSDDSDVHPAIPVLDQDLEDHS